MGKLATSKASAHFSSKGLGDVLRLHPAQVPHPFNTTSSLHRLAVQHINTSKLKMRRIAMGGTLWVSVACGHEIATS